MNYPTARGGGQTSSSKSPQVRAAYLLGVLQGNVMTSKSAGRDCTISMIYSLSWAQAYSFCESVKGLAVFLLLVVGHTRIVKPTAKHCRDICSGNRSIEMLSKP
jgi:hypothetical protein